MSRPQKVALGIALAVAVMFATTVTWAASSVMRDGLITVSVQERGAHGTRLYLPIPGAAVRAAVGMVELGGQRHQQFRARFSEVQPVLAALGEELGACPDMRLVEVESEHEHIVIEKRGGSLRITVDDRGDHVNITFPLDLATDLLDRLSA